MDVTVDRVAGIDVAKAEVVVALRVPGPKGIRTQEVRTYPAFTSSLASMADWLTSASVRLVVMESTGQYWKPVVRHEALLTVWG
jgi:transposase